jgi:hypothetical protein
MVIEEEALTASLQDMFELQAGIGYAQLHEALVQRIVYFLHHDLERLLAILYRIDVRERDTKAAFAQSDPKQIAPVLADAIIARELEKVKSRLRYKQTPPPDSHS